MLQFSYESSVGTVSVFHIKWVDFEVYRVQINTQYFIDLIKVDGNWKVKNPLPKDFYTDDIYAITDEIDKRLISETKNIS